MCASERALYMPLKESSPSVGTQFVKNRQISASCVARGMYLRGVYICIKEAYICIKEAYVKSPIARVLYVPLKKRCIQRNHTKCHELGESVYVFIYTYIYVCMYTYIHIYIHIYI